MVTDPKSKPRKRLDDKLFREEFFRANGLGADIGETDELERKAIIEHPTGRPRPSTGYANPPIETRFVKGKSGNPKGRPRRQIAATDAAKAMTLSNLDNLMLEHFSQPVSVQEQGEPKLISRALAYLKAMEKLGFGGRISALRHLQSLQETVYRKAEAQRADDADWVANYPANFAKRIKEHEVGGHPLPDWVPHPEDVSFSIEKGTIMITGACSPEHHAILIQVRHWRDAMYVKSIFDMRFFDRKLDTRSFAEFFVFWTDRLFPTRWKLASEEMCAREIELLAAPYRVLHEKLVEAFKPTGFAAPVRHPMPALPNRIRHAFEAFLGDAYPEKIIER